ncbi:hypothetical protein [Streptomyces sp. ITFR-6]|uniref:hypothetical protein n=1 Tax=Streptomyces sp. ITFR-6 TaxID=3075197 RepID=UPI00288A08C0|nr:hypothetical protein [Streptomyces sp. ITFR-6]WNI28090.1 hypothetical protein RLT59_04335 [Streptomyces sp. ITFR-6]
MTPFPGAPRGDARPRDRPDAPAHLPRAARLRQYLAALLLAVLTVTATATATGAGGAVATGAGPSAPTTAGPVSPVGHPAGTRQSGKDPLRSGVTATPRAIPGPGPGPRTRAAFEGLRPAPVTTPQPWAAAEHPRTPQHLPPPGPGAPLPRPPGLLPPLPAPASAPAAPPAAADRFRAALPGVRGPPGAAVHRPWDLSPVPSRTPAVAP